MVSIFEPPLLYYYKDYGTTDLVPIIIFKITYIELSIILFDVLIGLS